MVKIGAFPKLAYFCAFSGPPRSSAWQLFPSRSRPPSLRVSRNPRATLESGRKPAVLRTLGRYKMAIVKTQVKGGGSPTQSAFRGLLNWLDESGDSGGEKYLEMHRRLVSYFARKNCLSPDDLADETLTRVLRRLEEDGAIAGTPAARYCYITARFVFLEYLRRAEHRQISLDALPGSRYPAASEGIPSSLAASPEPDDEFETRAK